MKIENGIFDSSLKRYLPLSDRGDLKSPVVQEMLARNHHTNNLRCACGFLDGKETILEPRKLSGGFTVARENISEHHAECFLRRGADVLDTEILRSTDIFAPIKPAIFLKKKPSQNEAGDQEQDNGTEYDTFSKYARRVFSHALAESFLTRNRGTPQLSNSSAIDVLTAVDQSIRNFKLTDRANEDGYDATQRIGCRLRFGLVYDPVVVERHAIDFFRVHWFDPIESKFSIGLVAVEAEAMIETLRHLVIFDNHRAPPYFLIAVEKPNGRLQRAYLHQVCVAAGHLISAASGIEIAYCSHVIKEGGIVVSVLKKEDFSRVLAAHGFQLPLGEQWRFRPDFLAFTQRNDQLTLHIREVRGFKLGKFPFYDACLKEKETYYLSLFHGVRYKEIDGAVPWEKPEESPPEQWVGIQYELEAPAEDLMAE